MTMRELPRAEVSAKPGAKTDLSPRALERWDPSLRAAGDVRMEETISVLDPIGADFWGDGVTAKRIAAALRQIGEKPVTVVINSPGGDFFEGLTIYNQLREHPERVTVKILGLAASAASVIAMAGDEVQIARSGFLMIHNTWVLAAGDRHALRDVANWLEPFDGAAVDIYAARTGMAEKDLGKMLDKETWINGKTAVDQGFADSYLESDEVASDHADGGASARAQIAAEALMQRGGASRSQRRRLLSALKGGTSSAAPTGKPGAAVNRALGEMLDFLKSK